MCPGVGGIFCCFNEVVPKLLPGYEVFYDEHREDNEEEDKDVLSISEYIRAMFCLTCLKPAPLEIF